MSETQSTALKASRAAIGIALSGALALGMTPLAPNQAYADDPATTEESAESTETKDANSSASAEAQSKSSAESAEVQSGDGSVSTESQKSSSSTSDETQNSSSEEETGSFDRAAIWAAGVDDASLVEEIYPESQEQNSRARAAAPSVKPMTFSDEMLYFCKYESSCNYDQGLSSGDGYNAMGYFQFDRRYGLGDF